MVRHSLEEKMEVVRAWQASGLTKKDYCAKHRIAYSSFLVWCRLARTMSEETPAPTAVQIVPVGSVQYALGRMGDGGVRLMVGNVRVELDLDFSEQTLAKVIEVLKRC